MPLELNCTPELGHLRSTVRRFVRDRLEPIALAIDATGQVPDHAIAQMREQGYLGMRLPPGQGGGGFDLSTYCLVMEEVARSHRVFTL
ncbi:MAG: acyl-CoA dehydrogenase family protein, partial [Betaproteobacteria bacterium]